MAKKTKTEAEIQERVTQLFDEVKKQSKAKRPAESKDKPVVKEKPKSTAKEKRRERKAARGQDVLTGPTVTLKELAFDHEMNPKELRRLLRKSDVERPGGRWEWAKDSPTVDKIIKLIQQSGKGKN